MSTLYINPLPKNIKFIVLNENKEILAELDTPKNNDEFSFFPELLTETVKKYGVTEIWCVVWPGPFTLMRIITLAINSIAYTWDIWLKSCNFFDLIKPWHIPIIEANAREHIIRVPWENTMEYIEKGLLTPWTYEGLISKNEFTDGISFVKYTENLGNISHLFSTQEFEQRLSPIYFKPPHITLWRNTLSHSSKKENA